MKDRRLNVGMIGVGFIGQLAHLMNLVEITNCRVVAVADLRPRLRKQVAARYGIPRTFSNHSELLNDREVEAVVIVTPRQYTGPVALDCLNAGKHVLTEKPMAATLEQGLRLVEAAKARQVNYAIGYMKRYDAGVQMAKVMLDELIATQELGPVTFARSHCFMGDSYCSPYGHVVTDERPEYADEGWPIAPHWLPKSRERDFAAYLNTYSHDINLLRWLFGRAPSAQFVNFANPDGRLAVLDFGSFIASLETGRSTNQGWDEITEIFFADGRLTIRTPPPLLRNVPATVELYRAGAIQEIRSPQCGWSWSFRRQSEAFVDDCLYGRTSINAGSDGIEDLRLGEALWRLELARGSSPDGL